jgi:ABC-type uncharacterized transport system YnjBCD ATPase subunit
VIHIYHIFRRPTADAIRREQLYAAERLHLEHLAAAEDHAGLSGVYKARIERLRKELAAEPATHLLKAVK